MPKLGRVEFKANELPENLRPDAKVWHCTATDEVFVNYTDYLQRQFLLSQRVWSCGSSGKSGLNYLEALQSENHHAQRLSNNFPDIFKLPVCKLIHGLRKGTLEQISYTMMNRLEGFFHENESVEVDPSVNPDFNVTNGAGVLRGVIRQVLAKPTLEFEQSEPHKAAPRGKKKKAASAALQALSDLKPTGDVSDTPVDFAKLAAAGKDGAAATDGAPAKDPPGTGTLYIVDVYGRKAGQAMQVELTGTQMKRKKKGGFAREVLKMFMREHTTRLIISKTEAVWSIKPAMRIKYGLREIVIPKKKVPTRRPKNESEAAKARRLMQLESAPEEKENGDKPKWKVKRVLLDEAGNPYSENARKLFFLKERKTKSKYKKLGEAGEAQIISLSKIVKDENKFRKANARKEKLDLQKATTVLRNKEKAEQEKLDKEAEVERMKPREDLKLGDSKGLPVPVPLKILVSEDLVGGVLAISEWLGIFSEKIELRQQIDHDITYAEFEASLLECNNNGLLCDVVMHLMVCLFDAEDPTFKTWGGELNFQNTPLDSFTATELLRMYIYSDPKRTEAFGSVDLLTRMSEVNLFCFSLEDKVHILEFLCQQILATNELGAGAINEASDMVRSLEKDWRDAYSVNKAEKEVRRKKFRDDLEVLSKASKKAHALAEDVIEKKEAAAKAKKKAKKEAKKKGIEVPNESEEESEESEEEPEVSDDNDDDDDDAIGSDDDGDNDGDSTASKKKKKAPTGKAGREQVRRVALRKEKQVVIDAYDRIEADVLEEFELAELTHRNKVRKANIQLRMEPLGMDRYHRRYYIFESLRGGLIVEPPSLRELALGSTDHAQNLADMDLTEQAFQKIKEASTEGWGKLSTLKEIDTLIDNLNVRGMREKALKSAIVMNRKGIEISITKGKREARVAPPETKTAEKATAALMKQAHTELIDFEGKLTTGELTENWRPKRHEWLRKVQASDDPQELALCLVEVLDGIPHRFLKNEELKDEGGYIFNFYLGPSIRPTSGRSRAVVPDYLGGPSTNVERWRIMAEESRGISGFFMVFRLLEESVMWNKSITKARCKTCKKGTKPEQLLLCDRCNDGYHTFCLEPKLKKIPKDDWYCAKCDPQSPTRNHSKKRKVSSEFNLDIKSLEFAEQEELSNQLRLDLANPAAPGGGGEAAADPSSPEPDAPWRRGSGKGKRSAAPKKGSVATKKAAKKEGKIAMADGGWSRRGSGRGKQLAGAAVEETAWPEIELGLVSRQGKGKRKSEAASDTHTKRKQGWIELAQEIVETIMQIPKADWFLAPVKKKDCPDYLDVIKKPVDLQHIKTGLKRGDYRDLNAFAADCHLVFDNAILYNSRGSEITADARELKAFFVDSYQARVDRSNAEAEPEAGGANGAGSVGGSGRKKARGAKR